MLVDPERTFGSLAETLNLALRRWDANGAHEFELADGRRVGPANADGIADESAVAIGTELGEGDTFNYRIGPTETRRCRVLASNVDPIALLSNDH